MMKMLVFVVVTACLGSSVSSSATPAPLQVEMPSDSAVSVESREARQAILDTARESINTKLGKQVLFNVADLRSDGRWAFLSGRMLEANGQPFSYAGTGMMEAASHGLKSSEYVALMRAKGGVWSVVDQAIGPTDVPWIGWSEKYGAPADLFSDHKEMPQRLGLCRTSFISHTGPRLQGVPDSGTSVAYRDGGFQVSYDQVPAIATSKIGDAVWLCLATVPKNCPKGDDRGNVYDTLNLRTGLRWKLPSSAHMCGGA